MSAKRITQKLTKIAAFILGGILLLLISFHFWFVNHAEGLIEDLVHQQSEGKLNLKIEKFKFNWFSRKMELQQAVFYSTDTTTAPTAYRFKVDRIKIQVKTIMPVILEKRFLIDSIHLLNPDISVTRLRSVKNTGSSADTSLSIPQEMGRIYNSIQDALQVLKVDRFQIDNGRFSLINKIRPDEKPITISRLHFYLDNLRVNPDTTDKETQKKILFSDNVALQTTHQDILFPDGRHRLSFSNFRVNIRSRLAEFDSCTIIATKGDSTTNSFRIFFDKLRMTNIDFDTLYHSEVIKADSVYCINPRFRLDVDLPKRTGPVQPPKLDELIQQLTGDLQLAFVVVKNASVDINTMREGRPSSFTSDNNNFELQGLRIRQNDPKPFTVRRFAMAIRNFANFLRDSAYSIEFDSILLDNNRINLSNFSYKELKNNKVINSLSMPQFELQGLSWDDLVFEQKLNAEKVTLYRPVINYNVISNKNNRTQDIFEVLAGVGNILQLNNLDITEGQVNLFFANNTALQLEGATMSVSGRKLVDSRKLTGIQQSINELHFKKGLFRTGGLTATLENVQFNRANNGLKAAVLRIRDNALSVNAAGIAINSIIVDDQYQLTSVNGIQWQQADISFSSLAGPGGASATSNFKLRNINGANTRVSGSLDKKRISVFLETLAAEEFLLDDNKAVQLTGFASNARDLAISDGTMQLNIKSLHVADKRSSSLKDILYTSQTIHDSVRVQIPTLSISPDINAIIQGKMHADEIKVFQPFIKIDMFAAAPPTENKSGLQNILIGNLLIEQPTFHFLHADEKGSSTLQWKGKENANSFELTNFKASNSPSKSASADQLRFSMDHFLYTDARGKTFDANEGKLTVQVNKMAIHKNEADAWDWQGIITNLVVKDFVIDSLGKNDGTLRIASARLNNLAVSSSSLLNLRELVTQNNRFSLQEITGSYYDANNQFNWFNAGYDKTSKYLSADSFSYRPSPGKNDFIKAQTHQTDYITAKTGAIDIGPFDVQRYVKDTILDLGVMNIHDGYLTAHRDKRKPREPGVIKSLPVNLLREIPVHILVDTINVANASVEYSEVNEKTSAEGMIRVARLNGRITRVRNFNLSPTDSLDISASAFLEDTLLTRLHVIESYTDSLGGFVMTSEMGPADLTIFNPIIVPLAGAQLRSGKLDTMTMRVAGREELAFGEMKMIYRDLKVKVTGEEGKRSFLKGVVTFFANTMIKNNNTKRTGIVFFRRLRDRSSINYLVKIAMSGISSSIGIKKTKKQSRKHQKEMRSRRLPPIG